MGRAGRERLFAVAIVVASAAIGVALMEGVARLVLNPADFLHAEMIEDPVLGRRIQPLTTGHDALGFRNRAVPDRADIVAIGDSMTYGVSAPREQAWPQQLEGELKEHVYNMGLGGFGPLQYLHLAQSAAPALKPRLLVVGFYFGNDIMDAYYVSRHSAHWQGWRLSSVEAGATAFDVAGRAEPRKRFGALRDWLSRNSVLYSVLRETLGRSFAASEQERLARDASRDVRMAWRDSSVAEVRTIFTPQLRLAAVDLSIPQVREGMEIAKNAFAALRKEADRQGVALLVVLIPTKERAYCRHLRESSVELPATYSRLCDAESAAHADFSGFLTKQGIRFVDATPALEADASRHVQLYPTDSDGHPQGAGYGVIAKEVSATVKRAFPRTQAAARSAP